MEDWGTFLWTVAASSVGTTALLAALAFLLKEQIGHWLSKDLEAIKARHQRDLESYKVGLIAEAERAKAIQSVKTAAAMLAIERKFASLEKLHRRLQVHYPEVVSVLEASYQNAEQKFQSVDQCKASTLELKDALDDASPFLSHDDYTLVLTSVRTSFTLLTEARRSSDTGPKQILPERRSELKSDATAARLVARNHLVAMTEVS